jgi:hypothetical protein
MTAYADALRGGQWIAHRGIQVWQPMARPVDPPCPKFGVGEGEQCITRNGHLAGSPHAVRSDT